MLGTTSVSYTATGTTLTLYDAVKNKEFDYSKQ